MMGKRPIAGMASNGKRMRSGPAVAFRYGPYLEAVRVEPGASHWVSLSYFCITRLAISCLFLGLSQMFGKFMSLGEAEPRLFFDTLVVYVVASSVFLWLSLRLRKYFYPQLAAQLALDLCVMTVLMYASGGPGSGLAVLFLLPVAGAAILSPAPLALLFAALSSLAILGESVWRELTESPDIGFAQAGLYGASSFAIALVMNRLAARLIDQERIARERGHDLQNQIEVNRAVVADMQDGVLVLDAGGWPRLLNPAAARMLHVNDVPGLLARGWEDESAGAEISRRFLAWRKSPLPEHASVEFTLPTDTENRSKGHVAQDSRVRARFTAVITQQAVETDYVVFLEDLARVEERAQQLKLASMGRLTASIAHEIRNPLAAISHATALMAEDETDAPTARMLGIVQDNTRRLNRIVENILQLSRRAPVQIEAVALSSYLAGVVADFCRDQECDRAIIDVSLYGEITAFFNGEHLRQVLVNLLQNAWRQCHRQPGSIGITVVPVSEPATANEGLRRVERVEFIIQDDGPLIDPDARSHLFEPFFTTHHRGTGLGLFLARELCIANGATLNYVPNANEDRKGGFVINASGTSI